MILIPVIDLFDGLVVHAVRGQRDAYQPIVSQLASTPSPAAILAGYLAVFPFTHCYIADLNALRAHGDADREIATLLTQHPGIEFWIDAAFGARRPLPLYLGSPNARGIIGSESIATLADYHRAFSSLTGGLEPMLSLDFKAGEFLGPAPLLQETTLWPQRVIAMNLDRVGSKEGPDLDTLQHLRARSPRSLLTAAGGIRNADDLSALNDLQIAHALLATALHNGQLSAEDLARVSDR
ncbi:MAG: hypothetical protein EXR86_08800 [Gammaproteobacteria bacterium]|nr:hypothetical protein [Gammaproteobacteria bacterium]